MDELVPAAMLAFVVALAVTRAVELASRRRGLLDVPNTRSSHVVPTPRIGGVGIIAGVTAGWLLVAGWRAPEDVALAIAAGALALIGLADDLGRSSLIGKYLAQLLAATLVAVTSPVALVLTFGNSTVRVDGVAAAVLTVIGLTALINAFNFVDGIDGMLGGIVVVAALAGAALAAPGAEANLVLVAAAVLGFLAWNHPPASIFMGDVGSQFLGLWVGASLLRQQGGEAEVIPIGLLFAVVLFDTGLTLVRRAREGKNLLAAHREHLYQRLVASGASHRSVAALYAGATAILGIAGLAWSGSSLPAQLILVIAIGAGLVALALGVRRREGRASGG